MNKDILPRIMKYCAEAEKSTHDVLSKLESWGVPSEDLDEILKRLHDEKFLDDTRFARSYVSDKWNLDRWGKIKIENALQNKNIDASTIHDTLKSIDAQEYKHELHELLRKKWKEVKSENPEDDAKRILMFALSRGFEEDLIAEWIDKMILNS